MRFVKRGDENLLTDERLSTIEADASWHGSVGQGELPSVDRELHSGDRLARHVPVLVEEIRRLRELVPPDQRVTRPPERKRYYSNPKPIPTPPFKIPGVK